MLKNFPLKNSLTVRHFTDTHTKYALVTKVFLPIIFLQMDDSYRRNKVQYESFLKAEKTYLKRCLEEDHFLSTSGKRDVPQYQKALHELEGKVILYHHLFEDLASKERGVKLAEEQVKKWKNGEDLENTIQQLKQKITTSKIEVGRTIRRIKSTATEVDQHQCYVRRNKPARR